MRVRMTVAFAATIAAVLLVVCGGVLFYAWRAAERNADTMLAAMGERVGHDLEVEGPQAGLEDELPDLKSAGIGFVLIDAAGHAVRRTDTVAPPWPAGDSGAWRVLRVRVGKQTLVMGLRWAETAASLRHQAGILLLISLCVILAAAIGAWMLVGHTLAPIDALSRQAQAASADSLRIQLAKPSEDAEVARLVMTLNGLLARLADAAASRGRFYAAASHELRTPLQALSGHLEVALSRDRTEAEYRAAIDEAHAQTRRLASLVRDLLLLNQLDAATVRPPAEPVDLAGVCERSLQQMRPLIVEKALRVDTSGLGDAEVQAPPAHADMLVRNLIENAAKYATPGGLVKVGLVVPNGSAHLQLYNDSAPPPLDTAQRLGEPFYRPDASRNSETGGNGLGLAVCKAIADSNGWNLKLEPQAEGFLATVVFERNPE